jgi:CRISPR-associated protein Cas8a1/Csx13
MRYGRIADENKSNPAGMRNRMERFREKLRLDLAGAKTEARVRFALMDLFSRGGNNSVLRAGWATVLPVIRKDWQLARDLGLLALASYAGRGAGQPDQPEPTDTPE